MKRPIIRSNIGIHAGIANEAKVASMRTEAAVLIPNHLASRSPIAAMVQAAKPTEANIMQNAKTPKKTRRFIVSPPRMLLGC